MERFTTAQGQTNWWGISAVVGVFAFFLGWFKNTPDTLEEHLLFWISLLLVHAFAIQAARRRNGWIYSLPLIVCWVLVLIGLSGGIPV